MLLIACSLALLVMYAGVKLLAQIQKESLGKLYCYFSWFMIVSGFLMLLCIGCFAVIRCCHYPERMMEEKYKMMNHSYMMMDRRGYEEEAGPFWGEEFDGQRDGYYDGQCDGYSDNQRDGYDGQRDEYDGQRYGYPMKRAEGWKKDSLLKKK